MSHRTQAVTRAVLGPTPSKPAYELLRTAAKELRYPPSERSEGSDERWRRLAHELNVLAGRIENALKLAEKPLGEPAVLPVSFRWRSDLVRAIDEAAGDTPRSRWVADAIRQRLREEGGLSDLAAQCDDDYPPTSVIDALRP